MEKMPFESHLMHALGQHSDFVRSHALKWALENLPPHHLERYYKLAMTYRPYMHRGIQQLVDKMGFKVLAYKEGRAQWHGYREPYKPQLDTGLGFSDVPMNQPPHSMPKKHAAKYAAMHTWAKPLAKNAYKPIQGDLGFFNISWQSEKTTGEKTTSGSGYTLPGYGDMADPKTWMNLIKDTSNTVSTVACNWDPSLDFCKKDGATTTATKPTTMAELCKQAPQIAACKTFLAEDARQRFCAQYPEQCKTLPGSQPTQTPPVAPPAPPAPPAPQKKGIDPTTGLLIGGGALLAVLLLTGR